MRKQRVLAIRILYVTVLIAAFVTAASATYICEPDYFVYATPGGSYYHIDSSCSGMKNPSVYALLEMVEEDRPACPICCPDADIIVYGKSGSPYYHSNSECLGITNAYAGTLEKALAFGLKKCPKCWLD